MTETEHSHAEVEKEAHATTFPHLTPPLHNHSPISPLLFLTPPHPLFLTPPQSRPFLTTPPSLSNHSHISPLLFLTTPPSHPSSS
ncbi:uncharacterized protein LOC125563132 [Nematostella vectensis]|uniref:uncharacterized protein LOC125563132 n=1 Tax=Nematostella vectensis TaxID=45351 RepID=UPI002076E4BF|nr:uncharacterized protein LOC125563132 [Nematostella vectensis]